MEKRSGKISRKSEVRSPKPETQDSAFHIPQSEIEHPKSEMEKKSKVGSPKSELKKKSEKENTSASDNYRDDTSHSEIETLPTANSKLQTENTMEVHHHPRLDHSPKPWKEYLLEGLMIFLAVTMGFFAETIRESISDNSKGKEYIKSFVHDLRADAAAFSNVEAFDKIKVSRLNGQFACFDSISNNQASAPCLIILVKNSTFNRRMDFSDGTLQQLKNAGGFRLLNAEDKDSIVAYDIAARHFTDFESTMFQQQQDNIRNTYNDAGNYRANFMLFPDSGKKANFMSLPDSGKSYEGVPVLFSHDKAALNKYFNNLFTYRRVFIGHIHQIRILKKKATAIIKYFEDKYDLKK